MTPALFVELDPRPCWRPGQVFEIARIALRVGHPNAARAAGMLATPRRIGMFFADPACILAEGAFHGLARLTDNRSAQQPLKGDKGYEVRPTTPTQVMTP
jgi:hypothetical protein